MLNCIGLVFLYNLSSISPSETWVIYKLDIGNRYIGIALEAFGNVYVSDSHNHRIQKFAPVESESVITDGLWHHVGVVYDLDGLYRCLYLDGAEVAKDISPVAAVGSDGGLYIGADKTLEAATFFSSLIDDVRIYDVAPSTEEVANLTQ